MFKENLKFLKHKSLPLTLKLFTLLTPQLQQLEF